MAENLKKQAQEFISRFRDVAFLVDFDGTLVDLVPHPDKVDVPQELRCDLDIIAQTEECAFAIVTGRPLAQLDKFLNGVSVAALGGHGAEFRVHRNAEIQPMASSIPPSLCEAIQDVSDRHSCYFENKAYGLSLHLPFMHSDDDIGSELLAALGSHRQKYLIRKVGRTYEILQSGVTKGSGILHLLRQPRFSGRKPVYIGDDAHIDGTLHVVTDMGGVLIPARHLHHHAAQSTELTLETADVREWVSLLSQKIKSETRAEMAS